MPLRYCTRPAVVSKTRNPGRKDLQLSWSSAELRKKRLGLGVVPLGDSLSGAPPPHACSLSGNCGQDAYALARMSYEWQR
jgi:hypothetical protein